MKYLAPLCVIILITINSTASSQILRNPESVAFDSARNRYLVSNWNTGHLVQIDSTGTQDYFIPFAGCYAGLWIVGNEIYAAAKEHGIKGYNLDTGEPVIDMPIAGTLLLNDIVADTSGNLYLSDPQAHKIIKVNIATHDTSTFVSFGINVPNGMWFDDVNNRLILVSARYNSPIQAISLEDSSVSTILNTNIDIMDGIARDDHGNYYISEWGTSRVYRYDSDFNIPPQIFSSHGEEPADICFDRQNNLIAVPIFFEHTVDFIPIEQTSVDYNHCNLPSEVKISQNYPNPFNAYTNINFTLEQSQFVELIVYNILGQEVGTLVQSQLDAGQYTIPWQADEYPSGLYFAQIKTPRYTNQVKMVLLK